MALSLAQQLAHPYMLARTLYYDALLCQLRRDAQAVRDQADAAITVATTQSFALARASGLIMRGWALAVQEHSTEGLVQIRQSLDAYRSTGAEWQRPHLLTLLAEASGLLGQPEGGLAALEEALTLMAQTGERYSKQSCIASAANCCSYEQQKTIQIRAVRSSTTPRCALSTPSTCRAVRRPRRWNCGRR